MADQTEITEWLLRHAEKVNLRAKDHTWPKSWGLKGLFDIEVSIELSGSVFVGRGTAFDEQIAFVKAGAEAIERAYCKAYEISSIGVAAHSSAESAIRSARHEYFEREAFYCHFLTRTPFKSVSGRLSTPFLDVFIRMAEEHGVVIDMFEAITHGLSVTLCLARGAGARKPWGGIVGLSAGRDYAETLKKAALECFRNLAFVLDHEPKHVISLLDFEKKADPTAFDRQALALNAEFWKQIDHLFPSLALRVSDQPGIKFEECKTIILGNPFPELESLALSVAQVLPHLRNEKSITPARLTEFVGGRAFTNETLPSFLG